MKQQIASRLLATSALYLLVNAAPSFAQTVLAPPAPPTGVATSSSVPAATTGSTGITAPSTAVAPVVASPAPAVATRATSSTPPLRRTAAVTGSGVPALPPGLRKTERSPDSGGGRFGSSSDEHRRIVTAGGPDLGHGKAHHHKHKIHHHQRVENQHQQTRAHHVTPMAYAQHRAPIVTAAGAIVPGAGSVVRAQTTGHAVSSSVTTATHSGVTGSGVATTAQSASGRGAFASAGQQHHIR